MNLIKKTFSIPQQPSANKEHFFLLNYQKALLAALLLIAGVYFFTMPDRGLHIDEAILGEHAYWLAKTGKVKANMYAGTGVGWENELLVYHKLFIWSGAGIISLFGLSLSLLRAFILVFAGALCLLMYCYCKNFIRPPQKGTLSVYLLSLLLLFVHSYFFAYSFTYRPEVMQAALGFGSFYALMAFLKKERTQTLLISALLAGLGAVTHLNGLIFIGAGTIILLLNKEYKPAFIFAGAAGLVSSFYLINMIGDPESWARFIWQFKGDPAIEETDLSLTDRIIRMFHEHKRYFHSHVEGSFTILFLISLFLRGKYLWQHHRNLLLYPLFCAFFLACISQSLTSKYALLFLPNAILLIAISIHHYFSGPFSRKQAITGGAVFLIFAGIQFHHISKIFIEGEHFTERNAQIAKNIPANSHVYASIPFFFNEVENHRISSSIAFDLLVYRYNKLELTKEDFFNHVRSVGSEYIIIDLTYKDKSLTTILDALKKEDLTTGKAYFGYKVIHDEDDYVLMKRQQDF